MPNHTSTILNLTGNAKQIAAFIKGVTVGDNNMDFNGVVPMPEELRDTVKGSGEKASPELVAKFGFDNWYDWACANWGTKWGAYDAGEWKDNSIFYQTAWSPASEFLLKASVLFPSVHFKHSYADEGGGFLGWEEIFKGKVVQSMEMDWECPEGVELRKELGVWYDDEEADSQE